jgi:hypothetical protein
MKIVITSLSALLMTAFLAFAQAPSPSTSPTTEPSTNSSSSSAGGCLSGSDGAYTLTDKQTGMVFSLIGKTDALGQHVGHEVEVTGQKSTAASNDNSAASTPNPADTNPAGKTGNSASTTFQVDDVRMISDHCGASATTP